MRFHRVLSLLLLAVHLPACTVYRQSEAPLAQVTAPATPVERVRITTLRDTRFQVWSPRVEGDSLIGFSKVGGQADTRIAVALSDIQATELRKVSPGLTVGAAVLGAVVVLGAFTYVSAVFLCDSDGLYC